MAKFTIEVTDQDDVKILSACDEKTRTKILHRGVKDFFYRKEYNKTQQEALKAFTRMRREAGQKGLTVEQMLKSAAGGEE